MHQFTDNDLYIVEHLLVWGVPYGSDNEKIDHFINEYIESQVDYHTLMSKIRNNESLTRSESLTILTRISMVTYILNSDEEIETLLLGYSITEILQTIEKLLTVLQQNNS